MSGIATGTALAIGLGTAGAAASAGASMYGASKQAGAAQSAQDLQAQEAQNALDAQNKQWQQTQENQAPWLAAGKQALGNLTSQFGNGGPQWNQTFTAPTGATEQNDPGYQFRLQQGMDALQNSAAARGNLLTGGTAKSVNNYAQDYASNEYGNVYNRALGQYQQNYNQFQQAQNNMFNREAAISGVGQTAANTLASAGQSAANNTANINLTSGQQQGQQINNAAYQTASGYAGAANAFSGLTNGLGNYSMLQQILNQQQVLPISQSTGMVG